MLIMSQRLIAVLAAAASLAVVASAHAQPGGPPPNDEVLVQPPYLPPGAELRSEVVSYADLDLSTRAGARTLLGRIHGAAVRVCSPDPTSPGDLRDTADHDAC